jgi:tryptophan synthase beta subunit
MGLEKPSMNVGKKHATGTHTCTSIGETITVNNLDFAPSYVEIESDEKSNRRFRHTFKKFSGTPTALQNMINTSEFYVDASDNYAKGGNTQCTVTFIANGFTVKTQSSNTLHTWTWNAYE